MKRYMVYHSLPEGLTGEQIQQMAQRTQDTPGLCGLHSYLNLSEGTGVCIFDAENSQVLERFFSENQMSFDRIGPIEWEGDHGRFTEVKALETAKV